MLQKSIMDEMPEVKTIPVDELYIPHKYQRAAVGVASSKSIIDIQQNFDWALFGTLLVCKLKSSNVKYAIIDGQHRFRGVELRGDIDLVPCSVITPRDVKEQAEIFIKVNSRRVALSPLQYYRAALVAGNPYANRLHAICERLEIIVPLHNTLSHNIAPNTLQAVGYLQQLLQHETYTDEQLEWSLKTIRAAYPKSNGALRYNIVRAMAEWVKQNPDAKQTDMVKLLRTWTPDELEQTARDSRIAGTKSAWKAYISILGRRFSSMQKAA